MVSNLNAFNKNINISWMLQEKPAIVFNEKVYGKTLVIADLHLGFVYGQNKKGIIIPKVKQPEEDLLKLVKELKPKRLIILGDFKDEIFGTTHPLVSRAWDFQHKVTALTKLTIIKGNHDGKIEEILIDDVEIIPSSGIKLYETKLKKSIGLWHGHATPALDVVTAEITFSGHVHPAYSFRDELGVKITEKVWVKVRWKSDPEYSNRLHIIMPAFNQFIEGYSVDEKEFTSMISMGEGLDLLNAEIFTLDGVLIGTIKELQKTKQDFKKNY